MHRAEQHVGPGAGERQRTHPQRQQQQRRVHGVQPEDDPKFNTLIGPTGDMIRVVKSNASQVSELLGKGYGWARVDYPIIDQEHRPTRRDWFEWHGKRFTCGKGNHWRYDPEEAMPRLATAGRLFDGGGNSFRRSSSLV